MKKRKLILYIATSLDSYVATNDDNLDWLNTVARPGEDYGYSEFVKTVDTVIMGRKTYDKVLTFGIEFPHKERHTYVITRQEGLTGEHVTFYNGTLTTLIEDIRKEDGKHIFLDGGAELVNEFMKLDLVDEYILSVIPVFLGSGKSLFLQGRPAMDLQLTSSKQFESGLIQLHYTRHPA